jgi:DNA-binding response OmpR family regulator
VLEAGNAEQALAAVAAHQAGIDLLLTDVILTDANGRTLHERLAAGGSRHAVLYMSGYPADIIGRHGVLDEGVALIPKPFSVSTLSAKVREVLDCTA